MFERQRLMESKNLIDIAAKEDSLEYRIALIKKAFKPFPESVELRDYLANAGEKISEPVEIISAEGICGMLGTGEI